MGKIEGRNTVDHLYISYLLLKGFVEPLYINGWNLVNCYMAMSQKPGALMEAAKIAWIYGCSPKYGDTGVDTSPHIITHSYLVGGLEQTAPCGVGVSLPALRGLHVFHGAALGQRPVQRGKWQTGDALAASQRY